MATCDYPAEVLPWTLAAGAIALVLGGIIGALLTLTFGGPSPAIALSAGGHLAVQRDAQGRIVDLRQG